MGLFDPGEGVLSNFVRGKPDMPALPVIDPGKEQGKAISNNLAALPGAESLASGVNLFNQQQMQKMLENAIPNYSGMKADITTNIESLLKGEIPGDVAAAISRSGAAKSLQGGFAGSGMHGDLVARDLGTTSLALMQQGMSQAEQWMNVAAKLETPGLFNMSTMFLTPQQQLAFDTEERNTRFGYEWGKNLMDWQTSTGYALADEMDRNSAQFNQMAGGVAGSFLGGFAGA